MKKIILLLVLICVINLVSPLNAAPIETFKFDSAEKEKTFHKLSEELRCLVCQNQNIAESNAGLAKDLRLEIYNLIGQGKTEAEIIDFLVQRYGDYVLYRPPVKPLTWLLWFGPIIAFIFGLIFVIRIIKSQEQLTPKTTLNDDELKRIKKLHQQQNGNSL